MSDAVACVCAAERGGMFQTNHDESIVLDPDGLHHVETGDRALEEVWVNEYEQRKTDWWSNLINFHPDLPNNTNDVTPQISVQTGQPTEDIVMEDLLTPQQRPNIQVIPNANVAVRNNSDEIETLIQDFTLNNKQTQAFSMIAEHSCTDKAAQLRMFLGGPSGTGKSQVINALQTFFQRRGEDRRFHLASLDRKSTRLNSSHYSRSRMPSSA